MFLHVLFDWSFLMPCIASSVKFIVTQMIACTSLSPVSISRTVFPLFIGHDDVRRTVHIMASIETRASRNRRLTKFQALTNVKGSHPMIFDVGDVPHVVR